MIMGNDWREFLHFRIQSASGMNWEVHAAECCEGYLVQAWHEDDEDEDMPVPRFFYSKRNGDVYHQDIESFNPGFYQAIHDRDTIFWNLE